MVEGEAIIGIITERDVLTAVGQSVDLDTSAGGDAMTKNVIAVSSDVSLRTLPG